MSQYVGFDMIMAVAMNNIVIWDVTPCSWVEIHVQPQSLGYRLGKQRKASSETSGVLIITVYMTTYLRRKYCF
jgi:hypothetical protein